MAQVIAPPSAPFAAISVQEAPPAGIKREPTILNIPDQNAKLGEGKPAQDIPGNEAPQKLQHFAKNQFVHRFFQNRHQTQKKDQTENNSTSLETPQK